MTPEEKQINDELAKALALWKPDDPCTAPVNRTWYGCHCYRCGFDVQGVAWNDTNTHLATHKHPHSLPAPDLTSPEGHDLLEKTLLERGVQYKVVKRWDGLICSVVIGRTGQHEHTDHPDHKIALMLAAHKLVKSNG